MIHNIQPGPQVMTGNPALFWGLVASMWIGNGMLVILNLPLIGIWVKLLTVPYRFLYPAILLFCAGEGVVKGLDGRHAGGIRYPIPVYLRFQAEFPKSYQELERQWQAAKKEDLPTRS